MKFILAATTFTAVAVSTAATVGANAKVTTYSSATSGDAAHRRATMDPRCPADFDFTSCPSYAFANDLPPVTKAQTGNPLDETPTCFPEPEWQDRLKAMGLGTSAPRTLKPVIPMQNWFSHGVITHIAYYLLKEVLGFEDARVVGAFENTGNLDLICCGAEEDTHVGILDFERWLFTKPRLDDEDTFTVINLPDGLSGTSGLYVPGYTVDAYPLATTYSAYKYLPEYQNIFDKMLPCADRMMDPSNATEAAACGQPGTRWVCDVNVWTNTTCIDGMYVPPQCEGENMQYCQTIIAVNPATDSGYFEGMIKNNGLNFTLSYVGQYAFPYYIVGKFMRGEHFMFYYFSNDPIATLMGARMVNFDPSSTTCERLRNPDPTLNEAKCGYPSTTIQKVARRDFLRKDADLRYFFDAFTIEEPQLAPALVSLSHVGGQYTQAGAACNWLRTNTHWFKWIQHTPEPTTLPPAAHLYGKSNSTNAVAIAVPIAAVVLIFCLLLLAFIVYRRCYVNRHAPEETPLALLFTDVESSTVLWELCGDDMRTALDQHNAIIRRLIAEHEAYEVKTNGDSFMIACKTLSGAALLACDIQVALNDCIEVPQSIRSTYEAMAAEKRTAYPLMAIDDGRNTNNRGMLRSGDSGSPLVESVSSSFANDTVVEKKASEQHLPAVIVEHNNAQIPQLATTPKNADSDTELHNNANNNNGEEPAINAPEDWTGLRVRIGMHWCREAELRVDPMTQRYDYFGHDVNVCARVESYAVGGQILVEGFTYNSLLNDTAFADMEASGEVEARMIARAAELKGVQEKVPLWALLPARLAGRKFLPLRNVKLPDDEDTCERATEESKLNQSDMWSHSDATSLLGRGSFAGTAGGHHRPEILARRAAITLTMSQAMAAFQDDGVKSRWARQMAWQLTNISSATGAAAAAANNTTNVPPPKVTRKELNRLPLSQLQRLIQRSLASHLAAQQQEPTPLLGATKGSVRGGSIRVAPTSPGTMAFAAPTTTTSVTHHNHNHNHNQQRVLSPAATPLDLSTSAMMAANVAAEVNGPGRVTSPLYSSVPQL